jgi:hypothetical protein
MIFYFVILIRTLLHDVVYDLHYLYKTLSSLHKMTCFPMC